MLKNLSEKPTIINPNNFSSLSYQPLQSYQPYPPPYNYNYPHPYPSPYLNGYYHNGSEMNIYPRIDPDRLSR